LIKTNIDLNHRDDARIFSNNNMRSLEIIQR